MYIDSVCAPFLGSCCSDLTANGLWEKRSGPCQAECPNPFGWLVGGITAGRVEHHARRRDSNSFEQCTQSATRKLAKDRWHPRLYSVPDAGVLTDAQSTEILYQNAELRPVPNSMSAFSDFEAIFGRESLQCAFRYTHQHRQRNIEGIGAPSPLPHCAFPPGLPKAEVAAALAELQGVRGGSARPVFKTGGFYFIRTGVLHVERSR